LCKSCRTCFKLYTRIVYFVACFILLVIAPLLPAHCANPRKDGQAELTMGDRLHHTHRVTHPSSNPGRRTATILNLPRSSVAVRRRQCKDADAWSTCIIRMTDRPTQGHTRRRTCMVCRQTSTTYTKFKRFVSAFLLTGHPCCTHQSH